MKKKQDHTEVACCQELPLQGPAPQCFLSPVLAVTCSPTGKRVPSWKLGMGVLGDLAMGRKQLHLLGAGHLQCRYTAWPAWWGKHLESYQGLDPWRYSIMVEYSPLYFGVWLAGS